MGNQTNTDQNEQLPWLLKACRLRQLGLWPIVIAAGFLVLIELARLQQPRNAFVVEYDEFYAVMFVFAATGLGQVAWMRSPHQTHFLQFSLAQMFWLITLMMLVLGTSGFAERYGPLKLGFQLHLAEFDHLANEVIQNPSMVRAVPPVTVGPYEIPEIRVIDQHVVFCLNEGFGGAGFYGFARLPGCQTDDDARKVISKSYSLARRLKDDWFVVFDSYNFYKDGPS